MMYEGTCKGCGAPYHGNALGCIENRTCLRCGGKFAVANTIRTRRTHLKVAKAIGKILPLHAGRKIWSTW